MAEEERERWDGGAERCFEGVKKEKRLGVDEAAINFVVVFIFHYSFVSYRTLDWELFWAQ